MSAPVLVERAGPVAIVRLNRPERRNALDSATLALLDESLTELAAEDALRALVFSTTDVTALCAGADIAEQLDHGAGVARMAAFTRLYRWLDEFPVPVVAVAVGNCVGAGAEIVAGADLRVGGDNLRLAWAGARLGVPVGPARLVPLVGLGAAKDLVFTGRTISLDEALELGIVQRACAAGAAEATAVELAGQLAAQHPQGLRVLKLMFRELEGSARRMAYENERLMRFQEHGTGIPRGR